MAPGSTLLLEEYFAHGDDRFLVELLLCNQAGKLKTLAEKLASDARPWARRMLLRYVDDGCDRPFHRPFVKKLFKTCEAKQDHEAMGHFLVAFDRLSRRTLVKRERWNWQARATETTWELELEKGVPTRIRLIGRTYRNPQTGALIKGKERKDEAPRFSHRTREYLRRRAWRHFRKLGKSDSALYGRLIRATLALYEDVHLSKPEHLLDCWGLLHAMYGRSEVLDWKPRGVVLADGRTLADLAPAPVFPDSWKDATEETFQLAVHAQSLPVRLFAIAMLEADPQALRGISPSRLKPLLASPHEELQAFGAKLLERAAGLENLRVSEWIELLKLENPLALPIICGLVEKHVTPDRLDLASCVLLARLRAQPSARLGLKWLKSKAIRSADELALVMTLADGECPAVREEAASWLTELVEKTSFAKAVHLRELFDSRHADVRGPALAALDSSRFQDEMTLWAALAESPWDDARRKLVTHLEERSKALTLESARHVWATTLLAIHKGGRVRLLATNQVAERLALVPGDAPNLLPLMAIALRSVRAPERRTALAALVGAATKSPKLAAELPKYLPELTIHEGVTA